MASAATASASRATARAGGGGERVEQPQLALVREAHASIDRHAGVVERAGEPLSDPAAGGRRGGEQQAPVGVGGGEFELGEPDLERRLADQTAQLAADPLPIREIAVARWPELLADRGELDDDGALSLAAAVAEVVLNDRDRLGAAPPVRGAGGVVVLLVPWFPPRARVGRRGFCRGFRRGFAEKPSDTDRGLARKQSGSDRGLRRRKGPVLSGVYPISPI